MERSLKTAALALLLAASSALPGETREEPAAAAGAYTLREYEGCIAIYCSGNEQPGAVTDIEVRLLPRQDREMLRCGLAADDPQELSRLLEDLGS